MLFVDGLYHLDITGIFQRLAQSVLECLALLGGRHWRFGVEYRINEIQRERIGFAGIEQGVVDVGGSIVKSGE